MPTCRLEDKSPPVRGRNNFIVRRQPARRSKTEHSVILSGIVRGTPAQNPQTAYDRGSESDHITVSFETLSLPSINDFELPQELRDRASLTNERFTVDRTSSVQIRKTIVPSTRRRSNPPRNISSYKSINVDDHSNSRFDAPHVAVKELLNEAPTAQKSNTDGSRSIASDVGDPQILVVLQKVQNLIFKIQDHLHHLGRLLGATQSTWPPIPYDPNSVGDTLLNDYRETIGQWLNGFIGTPQLNSNLKELFKRFPMARLVHGRIVAALQESQNMVEMEHDGLCAEKWVLRDIRASNPEL